MGLTQKLGTIPLAISTDASNNVGIGGSPSGSYKLEVTGTAKVSGNLQLGSTTASSTTTPITLNTGGTYGTTLLNGIKIKMFDDGTTVHGLGVIAGNLYLNATDAATKITLNTNNTERLAISSTGAATFSGQIKTTFAGQSIAIDGGSTASVRMQLQNTSGNAGVTVESSTGGDQFSGTSAYSMAIGTYTAKDFFIGTNSVQRFKISSTGSATFTADIAATEFNGTNAVTLNKAGANGIGDGPFYRYINSTNSNQLLKQLNASSGEDVWAYASGAWNKIGNTNFSSGTYTALSDVNKKKDFELSTLGLDAILGLKPTLYRIKSEDENADKQLGFIAQEVKDFIPQAYVEQGEEDGKFIGLNYNAITATLVKAVQELSAQNQDLKSRLDKAGL